MWGSVIDYIGLRKGMLLAVAVWTAASMSHSWMGTFAGFALARAVLGIGEGGTFPGGLRTAVETLPPVKRARGIALSFSGGTIGAVMMPLLLGPLAISYGWRNAFLATGVLGVVWMVIWAAIARPPFLPRRRRGPTRRCGPTSANGGCGRSSSAMRCRPSRPGPVLTILALYLGQGLGMTQAQVNSVVWVPPLTWGIGYFFWGWAADKFAATNTRPIGLFLLLTAASLTLGFATWTTSPAIAIALISFSTFIGGGFQMVALKAGSFAFPREQSAMMTGIASGSWSLVNFLLLNAIGAGLTIGGVRVFPGANWMNTQSWEEIFWLIAVLPAIGIGLWMALNATAPKTATS